VSSAYRQGTNPAQHYHWELEEYPGSLSSKAKREGCPASPMSKIHFFLFLVPIANSHRCNGHAVKDHGLWVRRVLILGVNDVFLYIKNL